MLKDDDMTLKFEDIDRYKKQVKRLFLSAFPREERPPMWMLTRRCRQGKAEFSAVVDGDRFVGLTYVIGNDRVKTLMFLAIDDDAREAGVTYEMLTHGEYVTKQEYEDVMTVMYGAPLYKIVKRM